MRFSIITLFPEMFVPIVNTSILKRGQSKGYLEFEFINLRDFGQGRHQVVDGRPYGGGVGMLLRADILAAALKSIRTKRTDKTRVILTSASGKLYNQKKARGLTDFDHLIIIAGHYEGVDERFIEKYVDEEISIGDFVLTGGEIPTMIIIDSVGRLVKGVLEKEDATTKESFEDHLSVSEGRKICLLEHPQYTRPASFKGKEVPEILLSGDHQRIEDWKKEAAVKKTKKNRPDLLR